MITDLKGNILKIGDKVKIIKCSGSQYWYRLDVNQIFEVSLLLASIVYVSYLGQKCTYFLDMHDFIKVSFLKNKIAKIRKLVK